jgi:hypothetical protein
MPSALKACLVVAAILASVTIVFFGIAWFWWSRHGQEVIRMSGQAREEGLRLGRTTSEQGCLAAAIERHRQRPGFQEQVANNLFLSGCLSAAAPTTGFCDGVPSSSEMIASARWRAARCSEADFSDNRCQQLFGTVQGHCDSRARLPRGTPTASGR